MRDQKRRHARATMKTTTTTTTAVSGDYCGTHWTVAHESQKRSLLRYGGGGNDDRGARARICVCIVYAFTTAASTGVAVDHDDGTTVVVVRRTGQARAPLRVRATRPSAAAVAQWAPWETHRSWRRPRPSALWLATAPVERSTRRRCSGGHDRSFVSSSPRHHHRRHRRHHTDRTAAKADDDAAAAIINAGCCLRRRAVAASTVADRFFPGAATKRIPRLRDRAVSTTLYYSNKLRKHQACIHRNDNNKLYAAAFFLRVLRFLKSLDRPILRWR